MDDNRYILSQWPSNHEGHRMLGLRYSLLHTTAALRLKCTSDTRTPKPYRRMLTCGGQEILPFQLEWSPKLPDLHNQWSRAACMLDATSETCRLPWTIKPACRRIMYIHKCIRDLCCMLNMRDLCCMLSMRLLKIRSSGTHLPETSNFCDRSNLC